MSELKKVFGIDLGTTYSCISYVDESNKPVIVKNAENERITPSVVFFDDDQIIVGIVAKNCSKIYPDKVVSMIKRSMGESSFIFEHNGQTYKPEELSSFILRKVVEDTEKELGEKITDVVITIPAYFGINEREATAKAGEIAGLNVRSIINEPTAAAISYGINQSHDQVVLVYDLGGGTFDITMIDVKDQSITVICTGGDHNLGGKDWDDAIVNYIAEQMCDQTGNSVEDILDDAETLNDLYIQAENAKKTLTTRERSPMAVSHGGERAKVELTRDQFNSITESLLERTISLTNEMLSEAEKKGYTKFDKILLVGGSTRMPQVMEKLKALFPVEIVLHDPDESVANGAALFGWKLSIDEEIKIAVSEKTGQSADEVELETVPDDIKATAQEEVAQDKGLRLGAVKKMSDTVINNVTSKSFGVVAVDPNSNEELVVNLIVRNDQVPADVSQTFGTLGENQGTVDIRIMENLESDKSKKLDPDICTNIGNAILHMPDSLPKNSPIEVNFCLNEQGMLKMTATEKNEGKNVEVTVETTSVMSQDEVDESKSKLLGMQVS